MKLLTKEEEDAHYSAVVKGGLVGGVAGLALGYVGLRLASRRWHTIRTLTLPLKAALVTSAGTFASIIAADHASQNFDLQTIRDKFFLEERRSRLRQEELAAMTTKDKVYEFFRREKYKIIGGAWVASMIGSWMLIGRNPYLTGQQKIVQARVYAQGLTLAVLCASAAFEIHDQRKGRGILDSVKAKRAAEAAAKKAPTSGNGGDLRELQKERYQGDDLWKEMVEAEEERSKDRERERENKGVKTGAANKEAVTSHS